MYCGHADRAVFADPSEVVPSQIDEHDVLGALLLVALQLFGEPEVFLVVRAARARAGDRMRFHAPSLDTHEHFRRRPDNGETAHPHEVHVGRRVDVTQGAIDRERIGGDVGLEAL